MRRKVNRVYPAVVVAALVRDEEGKFLLITRNEELSIMTEHMARGDNFETRTALRRGLREEIGLANGDVTQVRSLGWLPRLKGQTPEPKMFKLFSVQVSQEGARKAFFREGDGRVFWLSPEEMNQRPNLDWLTKQAIRRLGLSVRAQNRRREKAERGTAYDATRNLGS